MAPSAKTLEAALVDATCQVFKSEPDATSVNKVRKQAEENLGLDQGFFTEADWKSKSKNVIKEYVEKLLEGWTPDETKDEPESKNGVKRQSSEPESPAPKRRKQTNKKAVKEESELSDLSEEEKSTKAKKANPAKTQRESKVKTPASDDEAEDVKPDPAPKRKRKRIAADESEEEAKVKKAEATDEDELSSPPDEDDSEVKKSSDSDDEKPTVGDDVKPGDETEYSDVIDEEPKPTKRKKVVKKESAVKKEPKAPKVKKEAQVSHSDDPNEAEIKKLQAQLVKCGVRKLWHNELKRYGDDARAKIRHLKKMLTDVGMDGRFSEARAREIKETRELMAEAEAAQEMNALWGMDEGGRASRSKAKGKNTLKEEHSEGSEKEEGDGDLKDEDDDDDDDDDDDEDQSYAARRRGARADLAFLGDESESD